MEGAVSSVQRKKIHPHKFALWIAIASIVMMFAGLTSAYIVRQAQGNWKTYSLPNTFWISTVVILMSSGTMMMAVKAFKQRYMPRYRMLMIVTLILGSLFALLQYIGFGQLNDSNIHLNGNPSESFLFIIAGLHLLHIAGGIIALLIVFYRASRTKVKIYNATGLEIAATYWHFMDALWIYLFVFFLANQ
ncbi:cytochrome c oxidase subunit 3 [Polluticoccus soli]|uniref:cytochrome c oxidase subunit 3 n=1 Tax=Polluticoccus soli TaxID=3034150 RepID=UPI0023E1C4E3|nr:cytochrome c oxidase subunit 3 [Flavipsychrobacter sp. JY13-12]